MKQLVANARGTAPRCAPPHRPALAAQTPAPNACPRDRRTPLPRRGPRSAGTPAFAGAGRALTHPKQPRLLLRQSPLLPASAGPPRIASSAPPVAAPSVSWVTSSRDSIKPDNRCATTPDRLRAPNSSLDAPVPLDRRRAMFREAAVAVAIAMGGAWQGKGSLAASPPPAIGRARQAKPAGRAAYGEEGRRAARLLRSGGGGATGARKRARRLVQAARRDARPMRRNPPSPRGNRPGGFAPWTPEVRR